MCETITLHNHFSTEVTVGFTESSYSSTEAEAVLVCVAVLSGELGTDITLHLDSRSGTALGEAECCVALVLCI